MKLCPNCGSELQDDALFCTACGAKLETQPPSPTPAFCISCGQPLKPGAKFCVNCGAQVNSFEPPAPEPEPFDGPVFPPQEPPAGQDEGWMPPEEDSGADLEPPAPAKRRVRPLAIVLPVLAVLIAAGGFFGWRWYTDHVVRARELAESAAQHMDSEDYSQAELELLELTELQPDNAEAVMELAKACLHQEKFADAARYLKGLDIPEDDERYGAYQRLLGIASLDPELAEINTEHFPQVDVTLRCQGSLLPEEGEITAAEDGTGYELSGCVPGSGELTLSYIAPDTDVSDEQRGVSVELNLDGIRFSLSGEYSTPHFEAARVVLASTDVSRYPIVTAYFRVEDPSSGETIEGLDTSAFHIQERIQGGEYLAREVRSAQPLEGNLGLSIDLVADKSSSISGSDMQKIKSVMTSFVNSLHYGDGDKAEILAFDSIVQQMCYYTNDTALLVNGINNMSTDGRTALYNAIHDGVHNAALQGGARCVIAFTDGMDNESRYTPHEIIQYANENQVPVYIIGVGYEVASYESTLRNVAQSTGGRYWFIDDLYDLQEIFGEIYAEQKELYAVEYVSEDGADAYGLRGLSVTVSGGGYRAREEMSFQAVRSVSGETHSSRYELIKGATSWEDAAKRCQEMGGHLATITSQEEMDQIISMAEAADLRYIWLGGYTSYDSSGNVFGHWVTGENFTYQSWSHGEPSRVDLDGIDEWYIMLWNIPSLGGWTWNDQRNDPAAVVPAMKDRMGFICEYET